MKTKRLISIVLCLALVLAMFAACGKDSNNSAGSTDSAKEEATAQVTQAPTAAPEAPTAEPTAAPTEAPTAEPTAEPTEAPADGTVDLEYLIEDAIGSIEYDSTSLTIDVTSSYGDIAYFSLDNSEKFSLSFRLSGFMPTENHQQIGIIIAPDVRNLAVYGKFMRTFSGSNLIESYGTSDTWTVPEGSGQTADAFTSTDTIYMKVERDGAQISFFVGTDGAEWTSLGQFECLFEDDLQIGFTGATFTTAEAQATIDSVKLIYG